MATSVNLPLQFKMPEQMKRDFRQKYGEDAVKYFVKRDFIQWQLYNRTGGSTDEVEGNVIEGASNSGINGRLRGQIFQLEKRLDAIENNDKSMILRQLIGATNKRINDMIEELIVEIRALNNDDANAKAQALREKTFAEIELLNTRVEEAFDTGLDMGDTE